jgi:hypothetical protein
MTTIATPHAAPAPAATPDVRPPPAPEPVFGSDPPARDPFIATEPPRPASARARAPLTPRDTTQPIPLDVGALGLVDLLLRDRGKLLERLESETLPAAATARTLVVTCLVGAGAFGASIGAYRGGEQMVYAAIKLPLAALLTAALVTPGLTLLGAATSAIEGPLELRRRLQRDVLLVLATLALGSLVLAGLTPVVLRALLGGTSYHLLAVELVGCCGLAGLLGLGFFARALLRRGTLGAVPALVGTLALFAVVGGQMTWALRPFLVRPRTEDVPFTRPIEGGLVDAAVQSWRSSRAPAPRPSLGDLY